MGRVSRIKRNSLFKLLGREIKRLRFEDRYDNRKTSDTVSKSLKRYWQRKKAGEL